jgi:NIMA-interacting peptidyl-prolyl cis-trans isomerase 1
MVSAESVDREGVESTTAMTTTATVVSLDAIADLAAAALRSVPPKPLPSGWVLKESRSNPNHYYYYNQETGISTWQPPIDEIMTTTSDAYNHGLLMESTIDANSHSVDPAQALSSAADSVPPSSVDGESSSNHLSEQSSSAAAVAVAKPSRKRSMEGISKSGEGSSSDRQPSKKQHPPKQVRVFHILKKHKDARRPSSWRNPKITISIQQAREEIAGILEILKETAEHGDPEELKATFQELAQTESDCSSAKRGGDLGYFGPKKMQPNFEQAAFALDIGQLSSIVETSSGVHVLLRVG